MPLVICETMNGMQAYYGPFDYNNVTQSCFNQSTEHIVVGHMTRSTNFSLSHCPMYSKATLKNCETKILSMAASTD